MTEAQAGVEAVEVGGGDMCGMVSGCVLWVVRREVEAP